MKRDIAWFLDLYQNEQLNLDPPYQRRSVWTGKDRKFFLDTIFRNYPCPAVFLHKEIDAERGRMIYHVVDGKQRLETIILFSRNDIAIDKDYGDERLNGKKWKQIEHDPDLNMHFQHYALPVEFMDIDDSTVISEVFEGRLSGKWVLPVYRSLRNESGQVQAVIAVGLELLCDD